MWRRKVVVALLVLCNLPLGLYTSLLHQRGTVDVMKYLHDQAALSRENQQPIRVLQLMPCHSTPHYS